MIRTDIEIYLEVSPRQIIVAAPSTELTIQDLIDTVRAAEDNNMSYPYMISASGTEDLGGGVSVAITAELKNAQVGFGARTGSLSSGTVTTPNTGTVLYDSGATFISDGLTPGSSIINITDKSVATVIDVLSETAVRHFPLSDGTLNTWALTDSYKIWPEIQCSITGGNLVAVDENGVSMSQVLPSFGTQIKISSSSSATSTELEAIQYSSYQDAVWIQLSSGNSGTEYPVGNREYPGNNLTDARAIAAARGFDTFQILESMTLNAGTNIDGFRIIGKSHVKTVVTLDTSLSCVDVTILNANILGTLDGGTTIRDCVMGGGLKYVNGHVHNCGLYGGISLDGSEDAVFMDCGFINVDDPPVINMGGSGQNLVLLNHSGPVTITNLTGPNVVNVQMDGGHVTLDSTITAGSIIISGVGRYTNNSNVVPNTTGLIDGADIEKIKKMTFNNVVMDGDLARIKDDNGTDDWNVFDLANDGRVLQ